MSFNNDEDGDGLAALFGGITPHAAPKPAAQAQPVVQPTAPAVQPTPAAAGPQTPAPFPGYDPAAGYAPAAAPGYAPPTSYDLPAPPDFAAPTDATQYPGLSPVPTAAPQYPGLAPNAPVQPTQVAPVEQYPATQYPTAAQYAPGQAASAQYPQASPYPGLEPPTGYDASPDLPLWAQPHAPAAQAGAPAPLTEPPGYPGYEQPTPSFATTSPAVYGSPVSYDLPAPGSAPSAVPTPSYEMPTGYQQAPGAQPAPDFGQPPAYPQTPDYGQAPAYPQTPVYEPTSAFTQTPTYDAQPAAQQPVPSYAPPVAQTPYDRFAGGVPFGGQQPSASYGAPEPEVRTELAATPVTPLGPLLPSRTAAVVTPEDLERPTVVERIGLVLALLLGPIGLIFAIVTAARGDRRRGWLIGISRISLVLAVLSTLAAVIVGIIGWNIRVDQMQHDDLAAASAEFCAAAEADPSMVAPPTLGFPPKQNSIPETIDALTAWTTRWTDLAAASPADLRTGLELLAAKGQTIVDSVTESRSVDDALNAQVIGSVVTESGVPAWYANYCVAP